MKNLQSKVEVYYSSSTNKEVDNSSTDVSSPMLHATLFGCKMLGYLLTLLASHASQNNRERSP